MIGRHVPPAYSPLTMRALLGGCLSSIGPDDGEVLPSLLKCRYGSQHVVLCDSGTSALTLALRTAGQGRKPVVALPAYGCYDLATAAIAIDAEVILYDLDPETLAPDPDSFSRSLAEGPNTVVVAYLYGVPFDVATLGKQAAETGAALVEDAAQGFGASVEGIPCGGIGQWGVLSFGRGKGVTGGGGGALLGRAAERRQIDQLPAGSGWLGWTRSVLQWALGRPTFYGIPASLPALQLGETVYHPPASMRSMPRIQREVLLRLLSAAEQEAEQRRSNGLRLVERVSHAAGVRPATVSAGVAGYLRFPVLTKDVKFRSQSARRLGVMPGYPRQLVDLDVLRPRVRNRSTDFPGAKRLVDELVTLPTHSQLSAHDWDQVTSLIG